MSDLLLGINISTAAGPGSDPIERARSAEDLGFDFISSSDHPIGDVPTNETWTQLSMIGASTETIMIAPRVLGVPFRNAAVLAKMAETLNRLTGNRLILGLGAGGMDREIDAVGSAPTGAGPKITGLEEAIKIIHGLWNESEFTFQGEHHQTLTATITPRPQARIPIWLGTFGPRALDLTGRLADGWIPSLGHAEATDLPGMRQQVIQGSRSAGRPDTAVQAILNVELVVNGPTSSETAISGTPAQVADRLSAFIDMGFDGFNFMLSETTASEQMQVVATEVNPILRDRHDG